MSISERMTGWARGRREREFRRIHKDHLPMTAHEQSVRIEMERRLQYHEWGGYVMEHSCDFCAGGPVMWEYPTDSIRVLSGVEGHALWLACDICHNMIEQEMWGPLITRALETTTWTTINRQDQQEIVASIHMSFRAARTGPPRRV